jgi:hypothetical protein
MLWGVVKVMLRHLVGIVHRSLVGVVLRSLMDVVFRSLVGVVLRSLVGAVLRSLVGVVLRGLLVLRSLFVSVLLGLSLVSVLLGRMGRSSVGSLSSLMNKGMLFQVLFRLQGLGFLFRSKGFGLWSNLSRGLKGRSLKSGSLKSGGLKSGGLNYRSGLNSWLSIHNLGG